MNLTSLLNQALKSDILKQGSEKLSKHASGLGSMSTDKGKLKTLGAGAIGGGLIVALMGSKKARKVGSKVAVVGGAAALGTLAYKVYNDWQAKQPTHTSENTSSASFDETDSSHQVLILKAMIAAAKSDGHVDEQEMQRIELAVSEMDADSSVQQLIHQELNKPLDPSEIARLANSPQQASEIYLASLLVVDEQNFMEKSYLQELSKQLNLDSEVTYQLEQQVQG
ncbi:tellurite resistance TerB family protein [Vibrio sp. ZSDE26]|uniref:Tellurite resistance TerB family protein n=1 Tax=Vibrio amylolyticus TaxID=2847292 RepID=A0A9X1XQM5_9VIBR|nr:tellurite resistance TerB family protein [Vibrio amylolyticus]MCK6265345.1 tellurite resistance TerB family protein [Vibrio amylolyticus]